MPPKPRHPAPTPPKSAGNGGDVREVEWQLAAPDLDVVRQWLGRNSAPDGLRIAALPAQQLHDVYLDTEDWRVFRAGFALRLREKAGRAEATLKGLHSAREHVADRRELTEDLADASARALAHASGPVASRVRDVIGAKPLRTLFEVRTSRERFAVRGRNARDMGELALDEARFPRANGGRRPMILTRVELEAAGPDSAVLERLAARLRTECGLEPARRNKFAAGLQSASLEPPRTAPPDRQGAPVRTAMSGSTRASDLAIAALRRLIDEWRTHEPVARLGESPEALHALRVTGRRMQMVLNLFRAHLPAALGRSPSQLKSLLAASGAVRDLDIRLEAVSAFRSALPEGDRHALDPLLRHLESERNKARATMLRTLDGKAARAWLESLPTRLAKPPRATPGSAHGAVALRVVPDLIRERYRKLRKCIRRLSADSPMSQYHELRLRAKKLRYALELVAPTYGQPADDMLAALHRLQGRLGTQHDSDVVARSLTQLAARPPAEFSARTLYLMGRLTELHVQRTAAMAGRIGKSWRKVRGKRWKALRSRMQELRDSTSPGGGGP